MAKKNETEATAAAETSTSPAEPRPPQGIVPRPMSTGNPRKDFHPYFRQIPLIDPESLKVDGQDPFLAFPIPAGLGEPQKYRIRPLGAKHAAELLTCDRSTGGPPTCRLATDEEVAQYHREMEQRRRQ